MGEDAYRHILRDSVILKNYEAERIVRKVGERIARAANKPDYRWEFTVINDPEMVNAFAVPGGKVAVYTGIFSAARDEAGLAVVLGHEVAHALARHAGERMSQAQLLGGGMAIAGASGINPQLLQVFGLGASVGVFLPFSRSQETEADRIGLILMAKAGYDPRVSLDVWERMAKNSAGRGAPPEFLSTHPSDETRMRQLRSFIPEALPFYRPFDRNLETLPAPESLDSSTARAERELLKRIEAVNRHVENQTGERAVVETLARRLRMSPSAVFQERQQLRVGYGQYAALKGLAYLGRGSVRRISADYEDGRSWSDLSRNYGTRLNELISWIGDLIRTTGSMERPPGNPSYRRSAHLKRDVF